RTIIVADDPQAATPLKLAAEISPDESIASSVELLTAEQLSSVEWDQVSLVLWQSALPSGSTAQLVESFVERGGQVAFFPPREPDTSDFLGQRWKTWT